MTIFIIINVIIFIFLSTVLKIVQYNSSKTWKYTQKSHNYNISKRQKKIVKKSSNDEIIQLIENYENNRTTK